MLACSMPTPKPRRKLAKNHRSPKKPDSKTSAFDVELFLDSAGVGRKVSRFRAKEIVFAQGDPATNVIYIQEGGVRLKVVNESGREAVVAVFGTWRFFRRRLPRRSVDLHGYRNHDGPHPRFGHCEK